MKMRRPRMKAMTKTDVRRWAARKNSQRGDPSNLSVHAFETDRMRAYYRGRRPDAVVLLLMRRRWDREYKRSCAICAAEGCDCQSSAEGLAA